MNKLLSAEFVRLKKNKFFWVSVGLMAAVALYVVFQLYWEMKKYDYAVGLERVLFGHVFCIGFLTAAFSGLFIGTEYSEGTIRNKLVIGHTRRDIYISSLIISITAGLIICLSYILAALIPGVILIGFSEEITVETMVQTFFVLLLMTAAFCAVFTMFSMLNQSKAQNCVIVLIGTFIMLFFSAFIFSELRRPEIYEEYVYLDQDTGEIVTEPAEPNPFYVSGTTREVYEFLMQFLPTGQSYLIMANDLSHEGRMAVYSVLVIVGSSAAGMYCFRKKDIK